jgi:hypothetical protein
MLIRFPLIVILTALALFGIGGALGLPMKSWPLTVALISVLVASVVEFLIRRLLSRGAR